jgi:pyruvate formate lyase activating enzyme
MFAYCDYQHECSVCHKTSPLIASTISACVHCIRKHPAEVLPSLKEVQAETRRQFDLPPAPPHDPNGVHCPLCVNDCRISEGQRGFCGLRENQQGKLVHLAGTPSKGILHWYYDPLPTNCVADWVCEGHTQYGYVNLAVFYGACSFNCLFCQNWHYRQCYFGGDPTPQMPHALATSRILAAQGVRVCWETNGTMQPKLLNRAVKLSLETGGCIKFDLKAYDENLHLALTGVTNQRTLENFAHAASYIPQRPNPPLVIASTLLVPGYVDTEEVGKIARFIASFDPDIPYALLGFHPHFYIHDLPRTSVRHAEEAEAAARAAGLTNVRVGNRHLLSRDY